MVVHQIVDLGVVGSSPISHPNLPFCFAAPLKIEHAPVAQLDRASDFESECRGFESLRAYQFGL